MTERPFDSLLEDIWPEWREYDTPPLSSLPPPIAKGIESFEESCELDLELDSDKPAWISKPFRYTFFNGTVAQYHFSDLLYTEFKGEWPDNPE